MIPPAVGGPATVHDLMTTALVVAAVAAAWGDVRHRRIPNVLTVGALVVALGLRSLLGFGDLVAGLEGAALAFGLSLVFFLMGGMGGGDVKWLAAVGAFLGPHRLWPGLFAMALTGGVMAVWVLVRRNAMPETAANLHTMFLTFGRKSFSGWKGRESGVALTLETPGAITVPYGIAISVGALAGWFLGG